MPKTSTSKATTITIRVGANTKRTIQRYAKLREMTPSEFVRYAVWLYMNDTPADPDDDGGDMTSEEIAYAASVAGLSEIEVVPGSVKIG